MRWLAGLAVGLALAVGVVVSTRGLPPSDADQAAAAHRLEATVPLLRKLDVHSWLDDGDRSALGIGPDTLPVVSGPVRLGGGILTPADQTTFDEVRAAVTDAVPGGRVRAIEDRAGTVVFVVAPQVLWGVDSPYGEWRWTWHDDPISPGPGDIDERWSFLAGERAPER